MKTTHTPGEWTYRPDPIENKCVTCGKNISNEPWNYLIEGKASSLIAKIWVHVGESYSDEANAKLIAAAPDLLSALYKLYVNTLNPTQPYDVILNECEKAIEKAGGFEG